jgi:hypothetical protein
MEGMSIKEDGDPSAADLARKRWAKTTDPKKRSAHARMMNETRWGADYVAKRPAAGRKKTAKKKKAG